jgi:alpha-D-xyloside xylohydrolase
VGNFWLDACEPGLSPEAAARAVYAAGPAAEAANLYTTGAPPMRPLEAPEMFGATLRAAVKRQPQTAR